jgi:hypothetical protein
VYWVFAASNQPEVLNVTWVPPFPMVERATEDADTV